MATKYEGKRLREVRPYQRKSKTGKKISVDSYYQRYDKPRGARNVVVKKDILTSHSKTMWLKNSTGQFIGRANSRYETTARESEIAEGRFDATSNKREGGRYGRVFGRTPGASERSGRRRRR